jgi:uncharacterized repeat protein (TIGR01451 family)
MTARRFIFFFLALLVLPARAQYEGLVINEFLAQPNNSSGVHLDANDDGVNNIFDDEFVELLNTGTNAIDVGGLIIFNTGFTIKHHVFPSRVLPPGGSIVVFGGGSLLNFSNPPAQKATSGSLGLNNITDTIHLYSPQTTLIDSVTYSLPASHAAASSTRNPDGTGGFTNHFLATTNTARASPGRGLHGQAFLTNQPPILVDIPAQTAFVGLLLEFPVRAYDPADHDVITLSLTGHPPNAVFAATNGAGTFSFTASAEQAGQSYPVLFVAEDDDGAETNTVLVSVVTPVGEEKVWINEIHYDNDGTDQDEGVEIAGTAGTILTNYTLVLYNGANGQVYNTQLLSGSLGDEDCGYGAVWFGYGVNGLQNDVDGVALVRGTNQVIQFLSYEGEFTAANGPAAGLLSTNIGVAESGTTPVGYSLQLIGTGTQYSAFSWAGPRPHSRDALNDGQAIDCTAPPDFIFSKTVYIGHDGGASCPGQEMIQATNGALLTYCFVVENTGGVPLTNVVVDDLALGLAALPLGEVATGATVSAYFQTTLNGDLRNTAVATGYDPDGLPLAREDSADVVEIIPLLELRKTVYLGYDGGASCPGLDAIPATNGAAITYCFEALNGGNTNLTAVTLSDPDVGLDPTPLGDLAAGEAATFYWEAVVSGDLTNRAFVTALDPNSDPVSDEDTAVVDEIHPAIGIQKTVYAGHDDGASCPGLDSVADLVGAPVTYCLVVTNSGDVALANVLLSDASLVPALLTNLGVLAAGQTVHLWIESQVFGPLTNWAEVTGTPPAGADVYAADSAVIEVVVPPANPALGLRKTVYRGHDGGLSCPGADFAAGTNEAAITWCFAITNSGDTVLNDVTLSDPDGSGWVTNFGVLTAGQVATLYIESAITADVVNVATVVGTPPGGSTVTNQDSAEIDLISPRLLLEKSVYLGHDGGASCPGLQYLQGTNGAPVTYCLRVVNIGDVVLNDVTLSDAALGLTPTLLGPLAVNQDAVTYLEGFLAASLVNTAMVTGVADSGDVVEDRDTAEVERLAPLLPCTNEIVNLGTLGGNDSRAFGINDLSQVVGVSTDTNGYTRPFRWESGVMTNLGILEGGITNSHAWGINNSGVIAGTSDATGLVTGLQVKERAIRIEAGVITNLGTAGGGKDSRGRNINAAGDVVGYSTWSSGQFSPQAFARIGPSNVFIGTFSGAESGEGFGINNQTQVVGFAHLFCPLPGGSCFQPFVWTDKNGNFAKDPGEMVNLRTFDLNAYNGVAHSINNLGQIVGGADVPTSGVRHAFIITPIETATGRVWYVDANGDFVNDLMFGLGTLPGHTFAEARDINDAGVIVGRSFPAAGPARAFRYDGENGMHDLNSLIDTNTGWVLQEARGINNSGEIVGFGTLSNQVRGFLLRPCVADAGGALRITRWIMADHDPSQLTLIWQGAGAGLEYTLETSEQIQGAPWAAVSPTGQWPTFFTYWPGTVDAVSTLRFFRVWAAPSSP